LRYLLRQDKIKKQVEFPLAKGSTASLLRAVLGDQSHHLKFPGIILPPGVFGVSDFRLGEEILEYHLWGFTLCALTLSSLFCRTLLIRAFPALVDEFLSSVGLCKRFSVGSEKPVSPSPLLSAFWFLITLQPRNYALLRYAAASAIVLSLTFGARLALRSRI
jgi:hypothetical protein